MNTISLQKPSTALSGSTTHFRTIRTFMPRQGRISAAQQRALAEQSNRFVLPLTDGELDWDTVFGGAGRRIVEIGFGTGQALVQLAQAQPQQQFLGIEVHRPGIGALLKQLAETGLSNVRIIANDAVQVLAQQLAPASVDSFHILFPDPWPKKRHHKRRLLQPPFVAMLASRLKPGGYVHCATDWQDYAEQMLTVFSTEPQLRNSSDVGYFPRPDSRPLTRFEARGLKLGCRIWDLRFERPSCATL